MTSYNWDRYHEFSTEIYLLNRVKIIGCKQWFLTVRAIPRTSIKTPKSRHDLWVKWILHESVSGRVIKMYLRAAHDTHYNISVSHIIIIKIASPQSRLYLVVLDVVITFSTKKNKYFYVNATRTTYKCRGSARGTYCTVLPIIVMTHALSPMENAF